MRKILKLYRSICLFLIKDSRLFGNNIWRKSLNTISVFALLNFPFLAYSAGAEFSGKAIFIQAFNFSIFFFAFLFLVRKPLQTFFHKKQKDFFAFEEQALKQEKEKQETQKLWKSKLLNLEKKEKNIQKKAQEEGLRFEEQKQKELEELSKRLERASSFLLNLEKEKLKRESFSHWRAQLVKNIELDLNRLAESKEFQIKEQEGFLALLQKQNLNEKRAF